MTQSIPKFRITDSEGKNPASFKHGFLQRMILDLWNPPPTIRASNGSVYQAVYDNIVFPSLGSTLVKVIVSFQSHDYGNFAIIRNLNEAKTVYYMPASTLTEAGTEVKGEL